MAADVYDIWFLVSQYLTLEELARMYGVNRSLFYLSMAARYRLIVFHKSDKRTKWLCSNLKNPLVRTIVRRVEVRPWYFEAEVTPQSLGLLDSARRAFMQLARKNLVKEATAEYKVEKAIDRIMEAVKQLPNLEEYKIVWDPRPDRCHPSFFKALRIAGFRDWTHSLRSLSISVPPNLMGHLASVSFIHLENLEISFYTGSMPRCNIRYEILNPLLVFVNNLCSSLQSLSILTTPTSEDLDLAIFFESLGTFPHLRHFSLFMPYDGSSFSTLIPLLCFLHRHKALRSVQLGTRNCVPRVIPTCPGLREWIPRILQALDSSFHHIQRADVALRPLKSQAALDAFIRFLSAHGHNVTSLTITEDNMLSFTEVRQMFNHFSNAPHQSPLEQLDLKVQELTPNLLRFLQDAFPRLRELRIGFSYPSAYSHFAAFCDELQDMDHQDFTLWGLRRINLIPQGSVRVSGIGMAYAAETMENALKMQIPSLAAVAFA
ncbi:hypothetical protein AMATHDRAFT_4754 [Amanita thiersii Skay4041]|uniref:F-box domain-containing protein n=1 Tax=Amanita thiersii Skay4041 TaxID=703135 RepID=A0A2A9NG56_9AGAR|nr:hypothetical protein AMATHDRAFT_4754 [Amanita thiersii Skay4041]